MFIIYLYHIIYLLSKINIRIIYIHIFIHNLYIFLYNHSYILHIKYSIIYAYFKSEKRGYIIIFYLYIFILYIFKILIRTIYESDELDEYFAD